MNYLMIYLKGMLMGFADLVPGVSGGTMALITGIYQRLINAIAAINIKAFKLVLIGQINHAWRQIDGWFLLAVFLGMISSIFLFASLIKYLLTNHSILTWSFFFGLIVSSAVLLIGNNLTKNGLNWLLLVLGVVVGYILSTQSIGGMPEGLLGILIAGMIAISAMILPGISGSLILILLGKYQSILGAVENREWTILLVFAAGCLIGLMVFSRLLKWLLAHFYQATIYALAGLMLGTLFKVWPWKSATGNVSPFDHAQPQLIYAMCLMIMATVFVYIISRVKK
ncbi:DUF368 domain-containing protein [Marinicella litoralis]|uniref:Putative membrane protein n=1 Tax=Marinicella litoralis TaxID=644220 RepID=A0A4R6XQQ9_9GAMM|nr:DUF368 domain-containing protein [Marinicella litoralis]TDR20749.1 putative membrane protein [Marinicella litoralis]